MKVWYFFVVTVPKKKIAVVNAEIGQLICQATTILGLDLIWTEKRKTVNSIKRVSLIINSHVIIHLSKLKKISWLEQNQFKRSLFG